VIVLKKPLYIILVTSLIVAIYSASYAQQQKHIDLNIHDVNRLALENNFDIQIYKLDKEISKKELLQAKSVYDTEIDASYKFDEDLLDRSSVLLGSKTTTIEQNAIITKKFPTGTTLSLGMDHARQATDSSSSTLSSYHESTATVSITQPLAKNFLGVIDRNTVKITGLDVENTIYTSLDKIEKELAVTQKAYWNLLLAFEDVALT